ncbi:MAG: hypothetical protein KatS3mg035_1675 [Bacteroidia bacterium]|nr:MAG: hypothetical protein KatS3mg035_1675 [Bacteroidia bacterium]
MIYNPKVAPIQKLSNSLILKYIKIAGMILLPAILVFLPFDYFDNGSVKCLSKAIFDLECWGCGMTRACMRIIHFHFEEAWYFNKLSFIVFPILCYLYAQEFYDTLQKIKHHSKS